MSDAGEDRPAGWYDFQAEPMHALHGPPMGLLFQLQVCHEGDQQPETVFRFLLDRADAERVAKRLVDGAAKLPYERGDDDDDEDDGIGVCEHCSQTIREGEEHYETGDECLLHEKCYPRKQYDADAAVELGIRLAKLVKERGCVCAYGIGHPSVHSCSCRPVLDLADEILGDAK